MRSIENKNPKQSEQRVYTLYRVSTKKQVNFTEKHETDIPMQREACHEFAYQMPGWRILKEFEEKGISGFKVSAKNRDAIMDLQDAAEKKEFDILLVFMFDRIGRIDDETPFVVEWFVKHGVQVWSVKEGEQRFENHVDKLTNYIRFWQASGESQKTSIRVKTRFQQLQLKGVYCGGIRPYGYMLVESDEVNRKGQRLKRFEIDPEQYEVVRQILDMTINEGCGSYVVARRLNERGVQTNNGSSFTSKATLRILSSPLLRGQTPSGETSPVLQNLRMMSDSEIKNIDRILRERKQTDEEKRSIAIRTSGKALLSGNVYCSHCGGRIVTTHHLDRYTRKDGSEYRRDELKYRCYHKANKLCDCDGQTNYSAKKIDDAICQIVKTIFKNVTEAPGEKGLEDSLKRQRSARAMKQKRLEKSLEKNGKQLDALKLEIGKALIGESVYTPSELHEAIDILKDQINSEQECLRKLETEAEQEEQLRENWREAYQYFTTWADEFDLASLERKKMIVNRLFERIELGKGYRLVVYMNISFRRFSDGWAFEDKKVFDVSKNQ